MLRAMSTVHDARPRGLAALPSVMRLIELALDEDLGRGDVTTQATVRAGAMRAATAEMVARAPLTVFGLDIAAAVFRRVDASIAITRRATDGDRVGKAAGAADRARLGGVPARGRAHRAELRAAAVGRGHDVDPLRRGGRGHVGPGRRHPQDHARVPRAREGRGPGRGLRQPPLRSGLGRAHQGQPRHRLRRRHRGGRARAHPRAAPAAHRGRGRLDRAAARGARREGRDRAPR